MTNQSDIRWPNSHTHDCVCAECMQARGKCNQSDKQGVREKIKKIVQDSHDCAEYNCYEEHDKDIDAIIDLVCQEAQGMKEKPGCVLHEEDNVLCQNCERRRVKNQILDDLCDKLRHVRSP